MISTKAQKQISKLTSIIRDKIEIAITNLAQDPRPDGVAKMVGTKDQYRIRVSDYRIIYRIDDNIITITVIEVGHRREVYK